MRLHPLHLLGATLLLFLYNEFFAFFVAGWRCSISKTHSNDVVVLVLSDVHILGVERGSWDVWWTTYALRRNFVAVSSTVKPDVTVVLGDHVDRGSRASADEFKAYADSFRLVTRSRQGVFIANVIGNHDYKTFDPLQLGRFEKSFGPVNAVRKLGGQDWISVNAMELMSADASSAFKTRDFVRQYAADQAKLPAANKSIAILLSHVAMYRFDDADCGPQRALDGKGVTYNHPLDRNVVGVDVLSEEATAFLLANIKPRLVLSGHTHAACERRSNDVVDVTVPTFSWRMRPDAGFAVIALRHASDGGVGAIDVNVCYLPNEHVVFARYFGCALLFLVGVAWWCATGPWPEHRGFYKTD